MKSNWNRRMHTGDKPANKQQTVEGSPAQPVTTSAVEKPPRPGRRGYENTALKPGAPGRGYETR